MSDAVPMTEEARARHDALRAEVRRIAQESGRPATEIAREIGIAYGTFSQWLAGTYKGLVEKYDELVQRWLDQRASAERRRMTLPEGPGFVATPAAQSILMALEHAQHAPDLVMVTGAAGVGKTSAIQAWRGRSTNVWVVTGEPSMTTPRMLLDEVAAQLAVEEWRSAHRVSRAVATRMKGTRGLLVIDEAQHLPTPVLDQVRTLHDMSGVGVALVGNERVSSRMEGGARAQEYAQLFSRVGMRVTRPRASKADIEAVLDGWGVSDAGARKLLAAVARKPGALRVCVKVMRVAMMQAAAAGEALSARTVELAYQGLSAQALDGAPAARGAA